MRKIDTSVSLNLVLVLSTWVSGAVLSMLTGALFAVAVLSALSLTVPLTLWARPSDVSCGSAAAAGQVATPEGTTPCAGAGSLQVQATLTSFL